MQQQVGQDEMPRVTRGGDAVDSVHHERVQSFAAKLEALVPSAEELLAMHQRLVAYAALRGCKREQSGVMAQFASGAC